MGKQLNWSAFFDILCASLPKDGKDTAETRDFKPTTKNNKNGYS
jgi:hypothetical protein